MPDGAHGPRGLFVSMLGIDGIGKSTLTEELTALCTAAGRTVVPVSWRDSVRQAGDAYPLPSLRNVWFEIFRVVYGGARTADGPLDLPDSFAELERRGGSELLRGVEITDPRPSGPTTAALLELAGNVLLHREVIDRAVAAGHVVVQESFGFKHAVKGLLLASRLAPDAAADLPVLRGVLREFFGRALAPDVGIHVAGAVELAQRWRIGQRGRTSLFEGLGLAGDDSPHSFLTLQRACAAEFDSFAREYGWLRVEMRDAPPADNLRHALDVLRDSPLSELLGADVLRRAALRA